jgi:hypothetical protein
MYTATTEFWSVNSVNCCRQGLGGVQFGNLLSKGFTLMNSNWQGCIAFRLHSDPKQAEIPWGFHNFILALLCPKHNAHLCLPAVSVVVSSIRATCPNLSCLPVLMAYPACPGHRTPLMIKSTGFMSRVSVPTNMQMVPLSLLSDMITTTDSQGTVVRPTFLHYWLLTFRKTTLLLLQLRPKTKVWYFRSTMLITTWIWSQIVLIPSCSDNLKRVSGEVASFP